MMPLPEDINPGDVGHLGNHEQLHELHNRLRPGIDGGSDGDLLALDSAGAVTTVGSGTFATQSDLGGLQLGLRELVVFESSGTFVKGDYPWLRAVRVRLVGGGGAGGGCASTGSNEASSGCGAQAGGYAETVVDHSQLQASETVTVASGGVGVSDADGGSGGSSSFGSHAVAAGGAGGDRRGSVSGFDINPGAVSSQSDSVGQVVVQGSGGHHNLSLGGDSGATIRAVGGAGGSSVLGGATPAPTGTGGDDGRNGLLFGAGGSGAQNRNGQPARTGGNGADGVVIVELYS